MAVGRRNLGGRVNSITEEDEEDDAWGEDEDSSTTPALPSPGSPPPKNSNDSSNPIAPPRPSMAMKLLKKKSSKTNSSPKTSKTKALAPGGSSGGHSGSSAEDAKKTAKKIASLEQQLTKLTTELQAAGEAKAEAESQLKDTAAKLAKAETSHADRVGKVQSELEEKVSSLQSALDAKVEALGSRDAEIKSLKEAASAAQEAKSATAATHAIEIAALKSEVDAMKKTNRSLELSMDSAERRSITGGGGGGGGGGGKESKSVENNASGMPTSNTQMFSKEITRLNYELKVAMKDKEKALALVIDLVGKKRLVRYLDEHGREENALRALKKLVRRGGHGSPDKRGPRGSPKKEVIVPRSDHGAWWSTRDLHEVSSARSDGQASAGNSPESAHDFRSPQQLAVNSLYDLRSGGSGGGSSGGGSSGKKKRSGGRKNSRRSPRNREYNRLLQMAHERAVTQQAEQRPPFVSTGRRQSLFSSLKGNGRVQNSRAVVEQAAREYSEVAGGDEFYY